MESLALVVSLIVLGRIAYVSLWFALIIYFIDYKFVDGVLQTRPGMPTNLWFLSGLVFAVIGLVVTIFNKTL
jgi:hypothetical protein